MGQNNFGVPYFTRQNYGRMYNEMDSNSNMSNNNNSVNKLDDSNNISEYSKNKYINTGD